MTDDLDAIADELYTLRPDEFAAARDARVREARQAGNAELARGLGQLRRPTQSAWLINLLWRDQRDTMDQLLELGAELSRAQAQASGTELRTLMQQRREVESALLQRARSLARERGVDVSAATEREAQETLAAALAEPTVAEEIRSGRLLKPTAYAGFGTPIVAPSVAARSAPAAAADELAERRARRAAQPREEKAEEPRSEAEREAAQELERVRERRAEAERQLQRAHGMANTAEAELEARTREAETARQHEAELARRVEQLQTQLRQLEQQLDAAGQSARAAARREGDAQDAHARAQAAVERAQAELDALAEK